MSNKFIFDVDGTLTPSRRRINKEFAVWFSKFCQRNDVYLVTGSDRPKTIEQVGEFIYHTCKRVYQCSGCDVWEQDKNVYTTDWTLSDDARKWLKIKLDESRFVLRTGLHIEERSGMVNYSIVGRNATLGERKFYVEYDKKHNERNKLAKEFNKVFPNLQAVVGGETGIDIFAKGFDKSQIIKDFDPNDTIHFFGDAMHPEGNDYPLKKVIIDNDLGFCYNINDYNETWTLLKNEL